MSTSQMSSMPSKELFFCFVWHENRKVCTANVYFLNPIMTAPSPKGYKSAHRVRWYSKVQVWWWKVRLIKVRLCRMEGNIKKWCRHYDGPQFVNRHFDVALTFKFKFNFYIDFYGFEAYPSAWLPLHPVCEKLRRRGAVGAHQVRGLRLDRVELLQSPQPRLYTHWKGVNVMITVFGDLNQLSAKTLPLF
jgi:hypothetical protein